MKLKNTNFTNTKSPISISNVDISKTVVSNRVPFGRKGFKYFIGYKNGKKVTHLCIMLQKMNAYRKDFDETKYMSFLIKNNELLEKYNEIWDNVSKVIKKGFDNKPV